MVLLRPIAAHGAFRHQHTAQAWQAQMSRLSQFAGFVAMTAASNLRQDEQTALETQTFTEGDRISRFEFFDEFSGLFVGFLRHFDL